MEEQKRIAQVKDCTTIAECEDWCLQWLDKHMNPYRLHAETCASPINNLDAGFWPDRMTALADAYGWAMMNEPAVRECEQQAIAILTAKDMSAERAKAEARRIHKLDKILKQLAATAQTKLMCLQSLNKQR